MGIAIVACLSYNMLLGQGGMLSFGHAVYTGLGVVRRHPRAEPVGDGAAASRSAWSRWSAAWPGMVFAIVLGYRDDARRPARRSR